MIIKITNVMNVDKKVAIAKRTVQVYKAQGNQLESIQTDASTLAELKLALSEAQISYTGLKFIDGNTDVTYDVDTAQLPQGDFILFAMPEKQKLGGQWPHSTNYFHVLAECRSRINRGQCTKNDFGGLGANNLAGMISELKRQDRRGNRSKGKMPSAKFAKNKSVLTKDSVLKLCRKKFIKLGVTGGIIKRIDKVINSSTKELSKQELRIKALDLSKRIPGLECL